LLTAAGCFAEIARAHLIHLHDVSEPERDKMASNLQRPVGAKTVNPFAAGTTKVMLHQPGHVAND